LIEQHRRPIPGLFGVTIHTAQRRIGQFAEYLVIINSDNSHIVGDRNLHGSARIKQLVPAIVVARQYTDWFWQAEYPLAYLLLLEIPSLRRSLGNVARKITEGAPGFRDQTLESLRANLKHPKVTGGDPAKGKMAEPMLLQMIERHLHYGIVVQSEQRDFGIRHRPP
jgi:hypothetical protein